MKIQVFYCDVYGFNLHLLWSVTPKQFRNYVRKISDKAYKNPGNFSGICYSSDSDIIIGLRKWSGSEFDQGNLIHEVFHGVHYSLQTRGIWLSKPTGEAYAYLLGSLYTTCLRFLNATK